MAPTSGGQYHWVSEFAPKEYQRCMSYFIGWISVLGWQGFTASSPYITGTMIQDKSKFRSYTSRYSICLLLCAQKWLTYQFHRPHCSEQSRLRVRRMARDLPYDRSGHRSALLQRILGSQAASDRGCSGRDPHPRFLCYPRHLMGSRTNSKAERCTCKCTCLRLSSCGPGKVLDLNRSVADLDNVSFSQTTFNDGGNWGSLGGSALIGIVSSLNPLMGADAAVHMSEEVKDAGRSVPRFGAFISYIRHDHKSIILTNIYSPEPS